MCGWLLKQVVKCQLQSDMNYKLPRKSILNNKLKYIKISNNEKQIFERSYNIKKKEIFQVMKRYKKREDSLEGALYVVNELFLEDLEEEAIGRKDVFKKVWVVVVVPQQVTEGGVQMTKVPSVKVLLEVFAQLNHETAWVEVEWMINDD